MDATFDGAVVRAGERARERFYDSRGYGRPVDGALELAPVEAAHLLFRGDLDAVVDGRSEADGEPLDFRGFLATTAVSEVAFSVYKDLRDRGFYLAPESRAVDAAPGDGETFQVFPRGAGPWDDAVAYRVLTERDPVVDEREAILTGDIAPPSEVADVPEGLDEPLLRALEADPADRYDSMHVFKRALDNAL